MRKGSPVEWLTRQKHGYRQSSESVEEYLTKAIAQGDRVRRDDYIYLLYKEVGLEFDILEEKVGVALVDVHFEQAKKGRYRFVLNEQDKVLVHSQELVLQYKGWKRKEELLFQGGEKLVAPDHITYHQ